MKVSDILRVKGGTLYTATPLEPLSRALDLMAEKDLGSLVVMEHGDVVGMLTFREVIQLLVKNGGTIGTTVVRTAMDDAPLTCTAETELDEVRRMMLERHMRNTQAVVEFLAQHPFVARVGHPLLPSHPSHALAQQLLPRGAGSVFSFDLKGSREQGKKFVESLKVFSHLANVGDCRSLVIHPASTTHFRMSDEALAAGGITQGTIRLSIGLEDAGDLLDDLKRALKAAEKAQ